MSSSGKNISEYELDSIPTGKGYKFAVIVSEWNIEITQNLFLGIIKTLVKKEVLEQDIHRYNVPGSFELVYGAKFAQKKNSYNAIIAVGCIVKGETSHFDFISNSVSNGIKDLNVKGNVPVIFCVLTDNNISQSIERSGGIHGNKGIEAAVSALKMASLNFQ